MPLEWDWHWHWYYLATVQASLLAAFLTAIWLIVCKAHKDHLGKSDASKIATCFLFGISVYTLSVLVIGQFVFGDLGWMVTDTFGEQRIGWMAVGLLADSAARLYVQFDP